MGLHREAFHESDLVKIGEAFPWKEKPYVTSEVELSSGGPRMLIVDHADGRDVVCEWRDERNLLNRSTFDYRTLKPWISAGR